MDNFVKKKLIEYLKTFVTKKRLELLEEKLELRTKKVTLVLEDIYQSRNISAAMRSADCFGIQDVHIIENRNEFTKDESVSLGANKWINIIKHNKKKNNTIDCIKHLKKSGYQIIATTTKKPDIFLEEIDVKKNKIAILLGTELTGLSNEAIKLADKKMKINMYGFTESLNISASAAICCQYLSKKVRETDWKVNENEKLNIMLGWLRNTVKSSSMIEEKFFYSNNKL